MAEPLKARAGATRFMHEHAVKYGLKIIHRDPATGEVISVRCEFCAYLGREDKKREERQRAKTEAKMTWTNNFRVDLYQAHLKGEHPSAWNKYQAFSYDDKVGFFTRQMVVKNTMLHHVNYSSKSIQFIIDSNIIDVLICDMFFHPDDHGGVTQTAAKRLFDQFDGKYRVIISNPMQFRLVIAQIARGISFRQAVDLINDIKAITGT